MKLGPFRIHLSRSLWPGLGWHFIDGRQSPPILTAVAGRAWCFGRGIVVSFLGLQLWATRDVGDPVMADTVRRLAGGRE